MLGIAGGVVGSGSGWATRRRRGHRLGLLVLAQRSAAHAAVVSHAMLALLAVGVALLLPGWRSSTTGDTAR
jgi:hypothetical protein